MKYRTVDSFFRDSHPTTIVHDVALQIQAEREDSDAEERSRSVAVAELMTKVVGAET
jgi:hypothetical protein